MNRRKFLLGSAATIAVTPQAVKAGATLFAESSTELAVYGRSPAMDAIEELKCSNSFIKINAGPRTYYIPVY